MYRVILLFLIVGNLAAVAQSTLFNLDNSTYSVSEGAGTLTVNVIRSVSLTGTATLTFRTEELVSTGSATSGVDFQPINTSLFFADGVSTVPVSITIDEDLAIEGPEFFDIVIESPSTGVVGTFSRGSVEISDNDAPGEISIRDPVVSYVEGGGIAEVVLERINGASGTVTVELSTSVGVGSVKRSTPLVRRPNPAATPDVDFENVISAPITMVEGETSILVTLALIDDFDVEGDEDFDVSIANPTGGASIGSLSVGTVTIQDDDFALPGEISFTQTSFSVNENGINAVVNLERLGGSSGIVSVDFSTIPGSATPGVDYTPITPTVTFNDGETAKSVQVPILDDAIFEGDENFTVDITNPQGGASIGSVFQAQVTILENDQPQPGEVQFTAPQFNVLESSGTFNFGVERVNGTDGQVTITVISTLPADTSATPGVDFISISSVVTFNDGEAGVKNVAVVILDDNLVEGPEDILMMLTNPVGGVTVGSQSTTLVVIDDDDFPGQMRFSQPNYQVNENAGSAQVVVQRVGDNDGIVSAIFTTFVPVSQGATPGVDYTAVTQTVTFADQDTTPKTINIPILDDSLQEPTEDIGIQLSSPTGGVVLVAPSTGVVQIQDNDVAGEIAFVSALFEVQEGVAQAVVSIERRNGVDGPVSVFFETFEPVTNAATAGTDYSPVSTTLSWANGVGGSQTVQIPIIDDGLLEGPEDVGLRLSNNLGGVVLGTPNQARLIIRDDEVAQPGHFLFSQALITVNENSGNANVSIIREGGSTGPASVRIFTSAGSATPGNDYVQINQTVAFADGEVGPKIIQIPIIDDPDLENQEDFRFELASPTGGATLGVPSVGRVLINDNDAGAAGVIRFGHSVYLIDEDRGEIRVTIERAFGSTGAGTFQVTSRAIGQAIGGEDFVVETQTVRFANNESGSKTLGFTILNDTEIENNEIFEVFIHSPVGDIPIGEPSVAEIIIRDDEIGGTSTISLTQSEYQVNETDQGLTFHLIREGDLRVGASIVVETTPGSARAPEDYTSIRQVVNFSAYDESGLFRVDIIDDLLAEGDETFSVRLLGPGGNGEVGDIAQATVRIIDNDQTPGRLRMVQARKLVKEDDGDVTIGVERFGGTGGVLTGTVTAVSDTAEARFDFGGISQTLTFADGESGVKTVSVPIFEDTKVEGTERFLVNLTSASAPNSVDTTEVFIEDNDSPTVRWASQGQRVTEDDSAKRSVRVSVQALLSMALTEPLTLAYRVGGKAELGIDHNLQKGNLTFPAGSTGATLSFDILGDSEPEPTEHIVITLVADDEVAPGEPLVHVVEILDNDSANGLNTLILTPGPDEIFAVNQQIPFLAEATGLAEGEAAEFQWEFCPSSGVVSGANCIEGQGRALTQSFPQPGLYTVVCSARVGDRRDFTPARLTIRVEDLVPPNARIVDPSRERIAMRRGEVRTFVGEVSPGNAQASWFLASRPDQARSGLTSDWSFESNGLYNLVLEATSPEGIKTRDFVLIRVSSDGLEPETVVITSPPDGSSFMVGEEFLLDANVNNLKTKREMTYTWGLGDGSVKLGQSGVHNYSRPGRYNVHMVANDGENRMDDRITIFVRDPNSAPVVDIDFPTGWRSEVGQAVNFRPRVVDNKGYRPSEISFFWDFGNGQSSTQPVPGKVTYNEVGVYTATLFVAVNDTGLTSEVVSRTIWIEQSGKSLANSPNLEAGEYRNLSSTTDENSFKVTITDEDQRLVLQFNGDQPLLVEVFDSTEVLISSRLVEAAGSVQIQGLEPGEYTVRITNANSSATKRGLSFDLGVAVLNPALFLPDLKQDDTNATQVGLVNPSGGEVSAEVIGYDVRGNLVDSVQLVLPPLGRTHQSLERLFGDKGTQVSWVQVNATRDLFGYSRTESRDEQEAYGVTAANRLSSELYVPHIAERTEQWYTRASVVNGSNGSSESEIQTPVATAELSLTKAYSKDDFDFQSRFGGTLPDGAKWARLKDLNGDATLAGSEIFGTKNGTRVTAGLQLADVRQDNPNFTFIGNNLYFTHIARDINQFWTGIALVNIGDLTQGVRIKAYGPDGQQVGNDKVLSLNAGDKLVQLADDLLEGIGSPANVDWLLVEADLEIVGYELFGTHDGERIAGLEATTALTDNLCFPFIDVSSDVDHGISVVNVNNEPVTLTFTLYNDEGNVLGTVTRNLVAHQKLSVTIEKLFPALEEGAVPGWLSCSSSLPLAGFELFVNTQTLQQMGALIAQ